jgi:hypothetical protein
MVMLTSLPCTLKEPSFRIEFTFFQLSAPPMAVTYLLTTSSAVCACTWAVMAMAAQPASSNLIALMMIVLMIFEIPREGKFISADTVLVAGRLYIYGRLWHTNFIPA